MQKKIYVGLKDRKAAFADLRSTAFVGDGVPLGWLACETAAQVLFRMVGAGLDVIYLAQPLTTLTREWFMSVDDPSGVSAVTIASYNHEYRSGEYVIADRKYSIKWAGAWFDLDEDTKPSECYAAFLRVRHWMQKRTAGQIPAMSTPGQTGLRLLETCLPAGYDFQRPEADMCEVIRGCTPQARKEIYAFEFVKGDPFFYSDGRWMYAACAQIEMPGELQVHTVFDSGCNFSDLPFGDYWAGWLTCEVSTPPGWNHVGLVPLKRGKAFVWPEDMQGDRVTITAKEAGEAVRLGWDVRVFEAWKFSKVRPLRTWCDKLIEMRSLESDGLYQGAIRNVMLNAIGGMYSDYFTREGGRSVDEFAEKAGALSRAQRLSAKRVGNQMRYVERVQKEGALLHYYMPHWVAYIWAECRVRLTRELLRYPYGSLIACNLDAVYSQHFPPPDDNGKPGRFRLKGALRGDSLMECLADIGDGVPIDWNVLEWVKQSSECELAELQAAQKGGVTYA